MPLYDARDRRPEIRPSAHPGQAIVCVKHRWPQAGTRAGDSGHARCAIIFFVVTLDINGERMEFNSNPRVADLIAKLALEGKKIAVERNGEIVPRSRFPDTWLVDGDRLEIVVAVGGG